MSKLFRPVNNLGIAPKLGILLGVGLAPLGLMTQLFVSQVGKDRDFARTEIQGVQHLKKVWDATVAVHTGDKAALASSLADLRASSGQDVLFRSTDKVRAFIGAAEGKDSDAAIAAAGKAIQAVADGSNLSLDPDLDSFYLVDASAVRTPDMLSALRDMHSAARAIVAEPSDITSYGKLSAAKARFTDASEALGHATRVAERNNSDGSVSRALGVPTRRFVDSVDAVSAAAASLKAAMESANDVDAHAAQLEKAVVAFNGELVGFSRVVQDELDHLLNARLSSLTTQMISQLSLAGGGLVLALVIAFFLARSIRRPVNRMVDVIGRFEKGDYSGEIPHAEDTNEVGAIARALGNFKILGEKQQLTVAALDNSPAMLMITDPEERIVFISGALRRFFNDVLPAFRANDPAFSVDALVGRHLDAYRKNPALNRKVLQEDATSRRARYDIDGRVLMVDLSVVTGADGERVGATLEWRDMTAELTAQSEIESVVTAASRGDFSTRISLEGKAGFAKTIAEGLNGLSGTVEASLRSFADAMSAVSQGDLTHVMPARYEGIFGELQGSIDDTISHLSRTVSTIQRAASDVGSAAKEINAGADDLSRRTEEQAASLEETAATTEELAASVKTTAQSSRHAVEMAEQAMASAQKGGEVAGKAVEAMTRIEQSAGKISEITSVIDEIAFQTNLLALNAAVEAARAGDAGKGFAVVAAEVRTLAQRSSGAAKDISALIGASNVEISEGVHLVRSAGDALRDIVDASKRVAGTISDISGAANEQANGIDEMSKAVAHMDEMTQQNAALAEESAASAGSLSDQIEKLNALMATFKTNEGEPVADNAPSVPTVSKLRDMAAQAFESRRPAKQAVGARAGWEQF